MGIAEEKLKNRVSILIDDCLRSRGLTQFGLAELLGVSRVSLYHWISKIHLPRRDTIKKLCGLNRTDYHSFMSIDVENIDLTSILTLDIIVENYKKIVRHNIAEASSFINICGVLCLRQLKEEGLETKAILKDCITMGETPETSVEISFTNPDYYDLRIHIYGRLDAIFVKCNKLVRTSLDEDNFYFAELSEQSIHKLTNLILEKP